MQVLTGSFEWTLTLLIFPQKCGEDSEPFEDWTLQWRIWELMISILSDVAQIRGRRKCISTQLVCWSLVRFGLVRFAYRPPPMICCETSSSGMHAFVPPSAVEMQKSANRL